MDAVNDMIDRFNNPIYHRYIELFTSSAASRLTYDQSGSFTVNVGTKQYLIKQPVYKQVSSEINSNQQRISSLYNQYIVQKEKSIGKEIQKLSDKNYLLRHFRFLANSPEVIKGRKLDILVKQLADLSEISKTKFIEERNRLKKEIQEASGDIDFYIDKLPVIEEKAYVNIPPKNPKLPRQEKIKEKIISQLISSFPLNKFKFKKIEECLTKAKSNPMYISKDELVETISNDNDLKRIFPKNYKKLKKEEICNILFQPIEKI